MVDLMDHNVRRPAVEEMLRPAEELLINKEFWKSDSWQEKVASYHR
jgi:hypothetical protein